MEQFLRFLVTEMEKPGVISWFHFIALIPIITAAILVPMFIINFPVGNIIQEKAGYPVYLITFLSLIAAATFLIYLTETSIYKLIQKRKKDSTLQ